MKRILGIAATLCAGAALAAIPANGDDVYLVNGKVYEGVIAEEIPSGVRIHLPIGRITIPHRQVLEVVHAPTALEELLRRQAALDEDPRATGHQWLELARWARDHRFEPASREAALVAARLDPELAGLEAILEPAGYAFDEERRAWVTLSELMSRRGYVQSRGRWVPLEVHRELERVDHERRRVLAETALLEAQRARVERQSVLEMRAAEPSPEPPMPLGILPWAPHMVVVVPGHRRPAHSPLPHRPGHGYDALVDRAPGSLIGIGRGMPPVARGEGR